jgi:hypothetical protein
MLTNDMFLLWGRFREVSLDSWQQRKSLLGPIHQLRSFFEVLDCAFNKTNWLIIESNLWFWRLILVDELEIWLHITSVINELLNNKVFQSLSQIAIGMRNCSCWDKNWSLHYKNLSYWITRFGLWFLQAALNVLAHRKNLVFNRTNLTSYQNMLQYHFCANFIKCLSDYWKHHHF